MPDRLHWLLFLALAATLLPAAAGRGGQLRITVTAAGDTNPMPARVILLNQDTGQYVRHFKNDLFEEDARFGYNGWPVFTLQGVHQPARTLTYELTGGTYRVTAGRGMSWRPTSTNVVVPDVGLAEIALPLQRIVDTEALGWWVGDAHVHVIHGGPGGVVVQDEAFQRFGEAVGLNWISLCQAHLGDSTTNWAGQKAYILPHSNATFRCWMGAERPKSYLGHLAMINPAQNPWLVPDDPPYYEASEAVRRLGGVTYPVHADRLFPGGDTTLFKYNNFYKEFVLDALLGPSFDAFSVISNSEGGHNVRLLGWWYALLQQGGRVAAMGDSDFNFQDQEAGMAALGNWVSYVFLSNRTFNAENVATAVREGRTFSSTGPLLFFRIGDAQPGDVLSPGSYTATLDVYCAHQAWSLDTNTLTQSTPVPVGLKKVEIYRNGRLFKRWDSLNAPEAHLSWPVVETDSNAFYTAHAQGRENQWVGAAASPIYFRDRAVRGAPLAVRFDGRIYDAFDGQARPGIVRVSRFGDVVAEASGGTGGCFRVRAPLDAELAVRPFPADAGLAPPPTHRIINHEPVFAVMDAADRNALGNGATVEANLDSAAAAISNLAALVSTVSWEFPLRYQFRNSYVACALTSDLPISAVAVLDGPPLLATNARTAAMLVLDKTRVQPGDTVNYAAIYRSEGVTTQAMASSVCYLKLYAWNPDRASSYSTWVANTPYERNSGAVDLGNGYHAYRGAITIPAYATNCYQGPGLLFDIYIRVSGEYRSSLQLYMEVGPTRRELLVSSAWPGLPPNWPNHVQKGIGPCNLSMSSDAFAKPINDYRSLRVQLTSGTNVVVVCPATDMAMHADTDDAHFYEWAHYYGQAANRGMNIRDPVRAQPAHTFPDLPELVIDPFSAAFDGPPLVTPVAPDHGALFPTGTPPRLECEFLTRSATVAQLHFELDGPGGSQDVASDGVYVAALSNLAPGVYTWQPRLVDSRGRTSTGASRQFTITAGAPDQDGDGLPDAWETAYYTNNVLADASADDDRDGFSNLQEYRAGTDPRVGASRLEMNEPPPPPAPEHVVLRWSSGTDRVYRVQRTDTLLGASSPSPATCRHAAVEQLHR
jgi:hypothetical protein